MSERSPAQVFAGVALPVGVLLIFLTPPFQVPDEPNHFLRAFQISDGRLVSQRTSDSVGGWLPRSIEDVVSTVMGRVAFNPDVKQDVDAWARAFEIPLLPHDRFEIAFPNTALSGPVAYLPQVLGIEIGKTFGGPALLLLYWGRLSSLLVCVALTTLAIRWLTIRPWTCMLLSLLPMTLFVRSSVSSDGPTLALTMLALAICLRPIAVVTGEAPITSSHVASVDRAQPWMLCSVAALLALGKPPYGAVSFLALATPLRLVGGMKRYVSLMLTLTAVFVVAQGAWVLAMRGTAATMAPGADPQMQLAHVVDRPVDTAAFLVRDLVRRSPSFAHQAVGALGWLDAYIPGLVAAILGLIVVLVALGEPRVPPAGFRWLCAAICGVGVLALHMMNYVWWTPPGAPRVEGIQGRHLLPLIPFLFLSINAPRWIAAPLTRFRPALVIAFLLVSATATLLTVLNRYYLDN